MKVSKIFILLFLSYYAQAQKTISSFDELVNYASEKSITLQNNSLKLTQAKKGKLAGLLSIIDPQANNSATFTNNTQLPVTVLPGEAFGGAPGTFREIETGVPYTTNINLQGDIEILNLQGWQNFKLAKININLTESNNKISLKNLQENWASCYYNIVSIKEQIKNTKKNVVIADSLYAISTNKFNQKQLRKQELNDAKATSIQALENVNQLEFLLKNYYETLKILCDLPENESIEVSQNNLDFQLLKKSDVSLNSTAVENATLQQKYAQTNLKQWKNSLLPTLSFVGSNSFQTFNQEFKIGGDWVKSNYIGLKLNFSGPNYKTIGEKTKAMYDYKIAQLNTEQIKLKNENENKILFNDYEKAVSQYNSNKEINTLKKDTYQKNRNLYKEGIINLEKVLNSYNAMVNAEYNLTASKVQILLQQTKININNTIK